MKKTLILCFFVAFIFAKTDAGTFNEDSVYHSLYRMLSKPNPGTKTPENDDDLRFCDINIDLGISDFYRPLWSLNELPTDEFLYRYSDPDYYDITRFIFEPDLSAIFGTYLRHSFGILTANYYLENADESLTVKRAEVRLLRAYLYMNLIDLFGDIPFSTSSKETNANNPDINPNGAKSPAKKSRIYVFKFIEKELLACADELPEDHTAQKYRPDKVAAWLLLSRLYLNAEVYTGTPLWWEAKEYAQKVMDSQYLLCSNYSYLFMGDNDNNGAQNEIILPVYFDKVKTQSYGGMNFIIQSMYDNNYDSGISNHWFTQSVCQNLVWKFYPNRDVPSDYVDVNSMIKIASDDRAMFFKGNRTVENTEDANTGLECCKFTNVYSTDTAKREDYFVDTDLPLLRLAEAYLTFAEADIRLNYYTKDALDAINTLRRRAHADTLSTVNLDDICDEWAREFYGEGRRRSDLIRFHKYSGGDYLWPLKGGDWNGTAVDSHYDLYPLPEKLFKKNGSYTQNPGYPTPEIDSVYAETDIPVAILRTNADGTTKTLTFTYSKAKTATAIDGSDGTYQLNDADDYPAWLHNNYWDPKQDSITNVVFDSSFMKARPTSTYGWFCGMDSLKSIDNISYLNTDSVTNMSHMFYSCGINELDLHKFNTAKVKDMSSMFGCPITNLDVSNFNTENVTNMSCMFFCGNLRSLDLRNFNTTNVTNMSNMFFCNNLTNLDVSSFDTRNVTDMSGMFGCYRLEHLDVSNFNTENVTNMKSMFSYCGNLKSLDLSHFNTSKVQDMSSMFDSDSSLVSLNLDGFQTSEVKDMNRMFFDCKELTSLSLNSFNTSKVTNMDEMFYKCSKLNGLDLSSFNTENVKYIYSMFEKCYSIKSINIKNFSTANVEIMGCMFRDCYALENLDISTFNFSNVTDSHSMFDGCSNISSLSVGDNDFHNLEYYTISFEDIGTPYKPCSLVISDKFDRTVLGSKRDNGSNGYYEWRGGCFSEPVLSSIKGVRCSDNIKHDEAEYNLAGQKINKNYRGITVVKGKKYIRR